MVIEAYDLFLVGSLCPANIQQSGRMPKFEPELLFLFVNTIAM